MRPRQRSVVKTEDTLDDAVEVRRKARRAAVPAVLDAAAIGPRPSESLEVDLECAGELLDFARAA